jgi:hypothetical protein
MPAVALLQTADDFTADKCNEVLAMVNERRVAAGLAAATWTSDPQGGDIQIALINGFRSTLEAAIPHALNQNVHAGGTLNGASAITAWTKAALLTWLAIGGTDGYGNREWTNVPAGGDAPDLADFVSNLYGATLITGPSLYKVWLNEIILAARAMTYFLAYGSIASTQTREGDPYSTYPTLEEARAAGLASWEAAAWNTFHYDVGRASINYLDGGYLAYLRNHRGKLDADLRHVTSGTAKCFFQLRRLGDSGIYSTNGAPHNQAEGIWGEWVGANLQVGQINQTDYIADSQTPMPWFDLGDSRGWQLALNNCALPVPIIVAPTFTYT